MLDAAESQLAERLEEACSHEPQESTAELVRLEEALSDAARAAKQAVSLRRRLSTGHGTAGHRDDQAAAASADDREAPRGDEHGDPPAMRSEGIDADDQSAVREFLDRQGLRWRVWAVTPEQLHPERLVADRMGDYRDGWLAFECTTNGERRRLPHYPPLWRRVSNLDLERLMERAEPVRRRGTTGEGSATTGP
jgi:hypothetical protein